MSFKLGLGSQLKLRGVHPDLVKVVKRAIEITPVDFTVVEGVRSIERQKELYEAGASRTMKSRHIHGFAVDIAPMVAGKVRWDWPLFNQLAPAIKQAAKDVGIPVTWGGGWKSFKDGPHWELSPVSYPDPVKEEKHV